MSLLNYLQFQPIDASSENDDPSSNDQMREKINLEEQIDEPQLEAFWDQVVQDIHEDPEWFNFSK